MSTFRPGHHGGEEEEDEGLQEAIRRSLHDHPPPNTGPHDNSSDDVELQEALEQNIQDNSLSPPHSRPPPYNPDFPDAASVDQGSADPVDDDPAGEGVERAGTSVRRRRVSHPQADTTVGETSGRGGDHGGLSREELRAARMHRFGRQPLQGVGGVRGRSGPGQG